MSCPEIFGSKASAAVFIWRFNFIILGEFTTAFLQFFRNLAINDMSTSDESRKLEDCVFFLKQGCSKGASCEFRHKDGLKATSKVCEDWTTGHCTNINCPKRHPTVSKSVCVYFQRGGCKRGRECHFAHVLPDDDRMGRDAIAPATVLAGSDSEADVDADAPALHIDGADLVPPTPTTTATATTTAAAAGKAKPSLASRLKRAPSSEQQQQQQQPVEDEAAVELSTDALRRKRAERQQQRQQQQHEAETAPAGMILHTRLLPLCCICVVLTVFVCFRPVVCVCMCVQSDPVSNLVWAQQQQQQQRTPSSQRSAAKSYRNAKLTRHQPQQQQQQHHPIQLL